MHSSPYPRNDHQRGLSRLWPFFASVTIHALLLWLVFGFAPRKFQEQPVPLSVLEWVSLTPQAPSPEQASPEASQIVNDPAANDLDPERARYLAERSSRVEKEMAGPRGALPSDKSAEWEEENSESQEPSHKYSRAKIFPTEKQLAHLVENALETAPESSDQGQTRKKNGGIPSQLADGDGFDALDPTIEKGNITLLNKKSFRFAGFIKRVAKRVFVRYLRNLYSISTFSMLTSGSRGQFTIETLLTKEGEQLSTQIIQLQGDPTLAEAAREAMAQEAWDLNPPTGAESADGFIHFLLIADVEYRWIKQTMEPAYGYEISIGIR
ncbi:MAG: hypothetical protein AB1405_00465 [Bdellovibrionota bacterium]